MEDVHIRHLFPGNNTSQGFFSYYAHILPQQQANHIYCIKGGPGTGKSTFLKRIGKTMTEAGYGVEFMHCSSDPDSLDGLVIPALGAALIDGTAPHVTDPLHPAAVDEIINLGDYWDGDAIKQQREAIMRLTEKIGRLFKRAYKYIGAAKGLMDDIVETFEQATNKAGASMQAQRIIEREMQKEPVDGRLGNIRKLFATAITPAGIVQHLDSLFDSSYKVYSIKNIWGVGVHELLTRVSAEAVCRGLDTEMFFCPVMPETRIEHVLIPELKLAFVSENRYFQLDNHHQAILDMTQYTDAAAIEPQKDALKFDIENFNALLGEAVQTLARAKSLHDELEQYYIPHMDFDRVRARGEAVCRRILALADNDTVLHGRY